ncbi:MAG: polyribonucleotide nucleotidyltransferase [Candidatus Omnitrophica bacterium]|nr:polyribonucleotide nucleotidyltransferase [Candidatus Omnitrophota bacterium]
MNESKIRKIAFGKEEFVFETGRMAKQANGSVLVQYGGTVVLVTACVSREPRSGIDFFPLTVEYQEKTYAAGKIPGGFFKREGRPTESEILTSRLIDRPIRPLFPKGMYNDVQIIAIVVSSDGANDPDVLAVNGASLALCLSDIPFNGPVACCRVGRVEGKFILNPTYAELEVSEIDVVVVLNANGVTMIECKSKEISEELFMEAVQFGVDQGQALLRFQNDFAKEAGKEKMEIVFKVIDPVLEKKVEELSGDKLREIYKLSKKEDREEAVALLSKELAATLVPEGYIEADVKMALVDVEQEQVRNKILRDKTRIDGRGFKDIRPITCEVAVLPRTHGSALFTRGQTQSLSVTTLGTGDDEQLIEGLEVERYKSFMLHYSFPPFSVGETKPVRGPGRREIGHGALAERALSVVIPAKDQFPYTIRVVSEVLESNGSSSMATVCAATLSLMDAGVPIKDSVAGVAMGLIKEGDTALILTDISGLEDHFGDMDFKVAGTKTGVTAVQLDLKIEGISVELLKDCVSQAKEARFIILDKMRQALPSPRQEISIHAPRIEKLKIPTDKIGEVIGPGGKNIKKIIAQTGAAIDIEDDGTVLISSNDSSKSAEAIAMIKAITDEVEVGKIYPAKVKRIVNFGAFCEIAPGKEGLVHVSELSDKFVKDVNSVIKIGDEIKVKVVGIDELGRINLSKKKAEEQEKG